MSKVKVKVMPRHCEWAGHGGRNCPLAHATRQAGLNGYCGNLEFTMDHMPPIAWPTSVRDFIRAWDYGSVEDHKKALGDGIEFELEVPDGQ